MVYDTMARHQLTHKMIKENTQLHAINKVNIMLNKIQQKPVFKRHSDERTPSHHGTFSELGPIFAMLRREPVMKGHRSHKDTSSGVCSTQVSPYVKLRPQFFYF